MKRWFAVNWQEIRNASRQIKLCGAGFFPGLIDFMCFNGLLIAIVWCESRSLPVSIQAKLTSSSESLLLSPPVCYCFTGSSVPSFYILSIPPTLTCFINRLVRFIVLKGWYLPGGVTSVGLIYEFLPVSSYYHHQLIHICKYYSKVEYMFRFWTVSMCCMR